MPDSPALTAAKIQKMTTAWETLAASSKFNGMTLAQFKAAVKASIDARDTVREKEDELMDAIDARNDSDITVLAVCDKVVKAVVADDNFGDNSSLYEAMGYVRKSERKSGLTRKKKTAPAP